MGQYIARRILLFIPTMFLVTLLVFLLLRIMPGDPALGLLLGGGGAGGVWKPEDLENLRHKLGTDRPIPVQYGTWIGDVVRGDLGTSFWYTSPVLELLKPRIPVTLELTGLAILISF